MDASGVLAKAAFVKNRGVIEAAKTVTGATNATPIVITTSTSHGYVTGDRVYVSGVTGNTAANGYWNATVVNADEFSLDGSIGNGAWISGGTSERLPYYPEYPETTTLAAGDIVPFASESIVKSLGREANPALVGSGISLPSEITEISAAGGVSGRLTYRGWERLVMCAMGFEHPDDSPAFIGTHGLAKAISDATNATPIVITSATHGYTTGDGVRVEGVVGNTAANGDWVVTVLTTTTFELNNSVGNGAYVSDGEAEKFFAFAHLFERDEAMQDMAWSTGERAGGFDTEDRKVRCGTFGFARQISDWLWSSVMVNKMTISGRPAGIDISFDLVGFDLVKGSYDSANWTLPVGSTAMCLFQQSVLKLGERSGGVSGLDEFCPSMWELTVDNKLKTDDRSLCSAPNIIQPVRSDFRETSLKLEFPRYNAGLETMYDLGVLNTELAASLIITGPQIALAGSYRKWSFFMSSLRYAAPVSQIAGPGPITHSFELDAHRPSGSDIFESAYYQSITLVKDSDLVVMCNNEDVVDYITER